MNHKDFVFEPDIRVCVYNIGQENLDYHKHTYLSDLTYCASGELVLELPLIKRSFVFYPGQIVQVPKNTVHRVLHHSRSCKSSRYVLIQVGKFSIDFIPRNKNNYQKINLKNKSLKYFIGNKRIEDILSKFIMNKPDNLSDSEHEDILKALSLIREKAILQSPQNNVLWDQLKDIQ